MTDRFAAQLRQHLVDSANERPAEGQLAALTQRVASTTQRRPLVARLTWNPGRVGPFPVAAARYGIVAAALLLTTLLAGLLIGNAPRPSTVFEGTWLSVDPGDGSAQSLVVGRGTTPAVHFVDQFATGAACAVDAVKVFTADGNGAITGSRLDVTWPDGGGCGLRAVEMGPGRYTYDQASDTIVDGQGLVWTRSRNQVVLPTRGPTAAPEATVEPGPTDTSSCVQFDGPGTYTARAGSLTLTADVGVIGDSWVGSRDRFALAKATCTDGQATGSIEVAEVTRVYSDACAGVSVPVGSVGEAAAAVAAAKGFEVVRQAEVDFNGFIGLATRIDMVVPEAPNSCPDQQIRLLDGIDLFDPTSEFTIYLIDAGEGRMLAVALDGNTSWSSDVAGQVDAILASLQISGGSA